MTMDQVQPRRTPILTIRGEKVGLGPIQREDLPLFVRWLNDFEVTRGLNLLPRTGRITLAAEEEWYESYLKDNTNVAFGIYEVGSGQLIGNCGLHGVDPVHRTATFGILIGDKTYWNKGCGTEATKLILDYGFTVLGLHNVLLMVYSYNPRAMRAYEKAGFKVIGRRRQARWLGREAYDEVYMDILSTEFQSPVIKTLLAP